jgi:hypothetical protein
MPLNDLLAQHQSAQHKAHTATTEAERTRFVGLETIYAAKIAGWRAALGLSGEGWPRARRGDD